MSDDLTRDMCTAIGVVKFGPMCRPLVSPCCKAEVVLGGQPAPLYTCQGCGKPFGALGQLVALPEVVDA